VAFLPLSNLVDLGQPGYRQRQTLADEEPSMIMFIFAVVFIAVLNGLAIVGWVHDSRDSADWMPTDDGFRRPRSL
jgi:hypothetical protein